MSLIITSVALRTSQAASELYPDTWRTREIIFPAGMAEMPHLAGGLPQGHPPSSQKQNQAYLDLRQEGVDGGRNLLQAAVTSQSLWASSSIGAGPGVPPATALWLRRCAACCSWPSFCEHRRGARERREVGESRGQACPRTPRAPRVLPWGKLFPIP